MGKDCETKTKAEKTKITATATKGSNESQSMDDKILGVMMAFKMENNDSVSLADISNRIGCHERNKPFRERWSVLKNQKQYIGPSSKGKGFQLTDEGFKNAPQSDEYKEMMKELSEQLSTNDGHQKRIKKYLKQSKSVAIFDFLNVYGSLTADQLCALVGQNKRSHAYFYSLKELRGKGYVEEDSTGKQKKFRLADKSYLNPENDRIKDDAIDTKKLEELVTKGIETIASQKQGPRKGIDCDTETLGKKGDKKKIENKQSKESDDDKESEESEVSSNRENEGNKSNSAPDEKNDDDDKDEDYQKQAADLEKIIQDSLKSLDEPAQSKSSKSKRSLNDDGEEVEGSEEDEEWTGDASAPTSSPLSRSKSKRQRSQEGKEWMLLSNLYTSTKGLAFISVTQPWRSASCRKYLFNYVLLRKPMTFIAVSVAVVAKQHGNRGQKSPVGEIQPNPLNCYLSWPLTSLCLALLSQTTPSSLGQEIQETF